ncbi:MAG: toll/interleukin-1 receptor domain-containing protein [Pseudomonadota bacterium]
MSMNVSRRLELISIIGRELQDRYTYTDLYAYLAAFGVPKVEDGATYSKWVYTKEALASADQETILNVARDLDLLTGEDVPTSAQKESADPPRNWNDTNQFRLFISHISKDKQIALKLSRALAGYDINGFVAHENIHPTALWEDEILKALNTMDALVAVHTKGFSESTWTQQEIGVALGRGMKVISFKMGEDPTGFLSRRQALARRNRNAEEIAAQISQLLFEDERTKIKLASAQVYRINAERDEEYAKDQS